MKNLTILIGVIFLITGCIGEDVIDDRVDERVVVDNLISELKVGDTYQFEITFFNNVGKVEDANVTWTSSNPTVISVASNGLAEALTEGMSQISVVANDNVKYEFSVEAGSETVAMENPDERTGTIKTTSSYTLEGDFSLAKIDGALVLQLANNFKATSALPGLFAYLSNNPSSISGAYEIGEVKVFSGANTMSVASSVGIMDYSHVVYFCKPFNVKVGDGKMSN